MNKKEIMSSLGGLVYAGLGIVLLATVANVLDRASVYGFIIPAILLVSGLLLLTNPQQRTITIVGGGMTSVGAIALLVRYTTLSSALVHTVLGVILVAVGVAMLSRTYYGRKQSADTSVK